MFAGPGRWNGMAHPVTGDRLARLLSSKRVHPDHSRGPRPVKSCHVTTSDKRHVIMRRWGPTGRWGPVGRIAYCKKVKLPTVRLPVWHAGMLYLRCTRCEAVSGQWTQWAQRAAWRRVSPDALPHSQVASRELQPLQAVRLDEPSD